MIHIAICDDEEVFVEKIRSEARSVLETQDEDFEIFCYTDGNKLLTDYEAKKFDLVLLDIDMPDVDGFEVAEKLNKINEKIDQLHDLKNTMIADVVTGKIDVRDIDIPKYEFTDESADSDSEDADFDIIEEQED